VLHALQHDTCWPLISFASCVAIANLFYDF